MVMHVQHFVWEACQDTTLIILMVAAVVSLGTEMWSQVLDLNLVRHLNSVTSHDIQTAAFNRKYDVLMVKVSYLMLAHVQGVKEGWYDGTAIMVAVLIVIVTTGE